VIIWRRLLIVLIIALVVCFGIVYSGVEARTSLLIVLSGNIGGYVAVHKSLNDLTDTELVALSRSWLGIIVPSFVGGILAFALYLFFLSDS
jgi:hypothetical protein